MNAPPVIAPVRFSHLRAYGRSALHGHHAREHETEETTAMERGTAVHALVFNTRKVCGYPGSQRRGKDFEAFADEHHDCEILTMAEYTKARLMADAVLASKVARPYLEGVTEETLLFRWNGLDCRATPDVRGGDFLTELKSSASSDPARFQWQALKMCYHVQMRMQQIAADASLTRITKLPRTAMDCFIICVESAEPFPVTVFRWDDEALERGERMLILWAERLKVCEQSGNFPPYVECVVPLSLPEDETELIFPEEEAA